MSNVYSTLIAPAQLEPHLGNDAWAVFDCRYQLSDHGYGRRAFEEGHLPGALFADMESDLSGPKDGSNGRHPLPDWEAFCGWLGSQGVNRETQVAAYDQDNGVYASRLWFMLRALGHERAAVLDGGIARWTREGRGLDTGTREPRPAVYQGQPDPALLFSLAQVEASLQGGGVLLVDARGPVRFRGEEEPLDPKAGHIPGAVNLPVPGNLDEQARFLPPEQLKARLEAAYGGTAPEQVVHYCGSGVSACHNLLAQAVTGLPPGRLYAGSWSEWCADDARPIATGEQP